MMKSLFLLVIAGLVAATPVEEAAATKTVAYCPATATPNTYAPKAPTCKEITKHNITYGLYTSKCYSMVDQKHLDRGETFSFGRDQPCQAAAACAEFAATKGYGYLGSGLHRDYAFYVFWINSSPNATGWQCYNFLGRQDPPPPINEYAGSYALEAFAYFSPYPPK